VAHAVEVAGVEQGDAGVERGVDGGNALAAIGRAVEIGHAHAAEAEGRDGGSGGAEATLFHDVLLYGIGGGQNRAVGADIAPIRSFDKLDNCERGIQNRE
jgi:hypothetical protein